MTALSACTVVPMKTRTRRAINALVLVGCLVTLATDAFAILVFDQSADDAIHPGDSSRPEGATNSQFVYKPTNEVFQVATADDFMLEFNTSLQSVVFWELEENDSIGGKATWDGTLTYGIWADTGGLMPSSDFIVAGQGREITKKLRQTGLVNTTNPLDPVTYDQYEYSFELESFVGLSKNTRYWLSLYLGQVGNITNSEGLNWQSTATDGINALFPDATAAGLFSTVNADLVPPNPASWGPNGTLPLAFQLYGVIPLPPTLALLAPMLLVSALRGRRRSPR